MDRAWTLWWLAGAVTIGLALPVAAVMVAVDHRRHRHWPSTALAALWSVLAASVLGVLQGDMSPPLFGVPLVVLYAAALTQRKVHFAIGVTVSYCLSVLVVIFAVVRQPTRIGWWFVAAWSLSLVLLILWRVRRPSAV